MKYDSRGILVTIIYHLILFGILIIMGFNTPLPLPAEKGFIIDFGDNTSGSGNREPVQSISKPVEKQVTQDQEVKESYMTQDVEEAPSLPVKKDVKKITQPQVTEKPEIKQEKKTEVNKEERKVNPLIKYTGKSNTDSESEGVSGTSGNQGKQDGEESGSHFVGNAGSMGIADVGDRIASTLPDPEYNYQKEGIVVVKVRVDRSGKVVYALPGVQGSTTLENYLLEAAKKAALSSKFNSKYDGEMYDEGTITYHFKLK